MTRSRHCPVATFILVAVALLASSPSRAYRMIQNTGTGRFISGAQVTCNDPGGFVHWNGRSINWYHNTAGQGAGKQTALTNAMNSWTNVAGANHVLTYAGTTTAGWATDGRNTILWAVGNNCTDATGCLALTALVLQPGQVIVESDITYNANRTWNTNGTAWDVESLAAHELGHSLGIHHTELTSAPLPTMYPDNFGDTTWRTLEADDHAALQCSESRYPPVCVPYNNVCSVDADCCSNRCWIKTLPPRCAM